jgi:hypothetical protein
LHYTVDGVEDSLDIMSNITDPDSLTSGVWGLLPCSVTPPSEVSYWIEAGEEGKSGESKIRTFTVLTPEHPDADILLVDDTGYDIIIGGTDTVPAGAAYEEVLDSLEKIYEYWNVKEHRGIDSSVINYGWGDIVWAGGMPPFALPDPTDSTSFVTDHPVTVFLDNGGCIFFSAHRYFDFFFGDDTQRAFGPGMWVHDYMGLAVGYAENISDTAFLGVANDPITGDWAVDPFITNKWWESNSDGAAANPEAIDIFIGAQTSQTAGTRFCNTVNESKIVFLPWDYLAACASAEVLPYAIGLMDNVLGWFLVGVEEEHSPYVFALSQSHPNPFRNNTTILYEIPKNALVSLKVYDITGRTVRILENDEKNAGLHTISWDGKDDKNREVPDGIYFYRLEAGENTATGKMVIMR